MAALAAAGWATGALDGERSLARVAAETGRYYGSAVWIDRIAGDQAYREAIVRECAYLTPENDLKWASIEPRPGVPSLAPMDDLVSFARTNGMRVHGHTLLWHRSVPDWAGDALLHDKDWKTVRKHLAAVMTRYGAGIEQWDVINEPIETGYREDGLRESIFLRTFGPDYIRRAREEAS